MKKIEVIRISRIVVTGCAGFIGSHIAEELVKKGEDEIIGIDNLSAGKLENIAGFRDKIQFHNVDILDQGSLLRIFKKADYVIHQAALRSVPKSVEQPREYNQVNIDGTFKVLEAAQKCKVKRVIFASSSSIYGDTDIFPSKETQLPDPMSPYAITKQVGEYYCKYFYKQFGLETVSLRYFNVTGPRQDPNCQYAAVIPNFIVKILDGKPPVIYGDGNQSRDIVYVKDVVKANLRMLTAKNVAGKSFNVGAGVTFDINDLANRIGILINKIPPDKKYESTRAGDVYTTLADISKIKEAIDFNPTKITDWLKETIGWFKSQSLKEMRK